MARLSKYVMGGLVGAVLGLLLAPKTGREMRQMLFGGNRAALPPGDEPYGKTAQPASPPFDLEARIEETRKQVETELEAAMPAAGPVIDVKEAVEATAPADEAAVDEVETEPAAEVEAAPEIEEEPQAQEGYESAPIEEPEEEMAIEEEAFAVESPALKADLGIEDEPAVESPAAEAEEAGEGRPEPARIDPDEMRKRIEETRNRLKAKAFDSMVEGETFIAKEDADTEAVDDEKREPVIDQEASEAIDESLREED